MKIFFDLDGTLIDTSQRHYATYKNTIKQLNGNPISFSEYWQLKRNNIEIKNLLERSKLSPSLAHEYRKNFINQIENPLLLPMDTLFHYTIPVLKNMHKKFELYLMSYRQDAALGLQQVKKLQIKKYFTQIYIGKFLKTGYETKANIISSITSQKDTIIVGDTEDDILAAKLSGCISISVLSGIRNKKQLNKYEQNFIIKDISEMEKILTAV